MNEKSFSGILKTVAFSFTVYLIMVTLAVILAAASKDGSNASFIRFLGTAAQYINYLFLGSLACSGVMMLVLRKDKAPMSFLGGLFLLAYVIISIVWIVKSHTVGLGDVTSFVHTSLILLMLMPVILACALVAISRCYEIRGLRVRSIIMLVLALICMILLLVLKNGGVQSEDSALGTFGIYGILLLAFEIIEAVFFFKWAKAENNAIENE